MKKNLAALSAILICAALASCGNENSSNSVPVTEKAESSVTSAADTSGEETSFVSTAASESETVTEAEVSDSDAADVVYINASMLTEDPETEGSTVFAVKDGRFIYVGNDENAVPKNGSTQIVDLSGKYVTPNLIDAHTHPATVAMTKWCTEIDGETKEELLDQIKEDLSEKDPETEPYVFFKCYPSDLFPDGEPRREWLDDICEELGKDFAIAISDFNDHSVWVNTKWLKIYGAFNEDGTVNEDADPRKVDGFQKDPDGSYYGLVVELAWMDYMDEFYEKLGWRPPIDQTEELMSIVTDDLKSWGMTGVFDAYIESDQQVESVYNLDKAGKLNMYYDLSVKLTSYDDIDDTIERIQRLDGQYHTDHVKVDTIKVFYDGTNEAGTGSSVDGITGEPDNHGWLMMDEDQTYELFRKANEAGLDVQLHMVGDLAFRQACNAAERLENEVGTLDSQIEFCHCEYINPEDRERPAKLGIIINWTPHWSGGYFGEGALRYLGEERYNDMYQFNPTIKAGGIVTFGSDIYSWDEEQRANPYFGMQTAMTRFDLEYPLEDDDGNPKMRECEAAKLSLEDLMKGYTINAAVALRVDDVTGSVTVGKSANFNIYGENLFDVPVDELQNVLPETVIFEGREIARN